MRYALALSDSRAATLYPPGAQLEPRTCKPVFYKSQLLDRFERWLLVCGYSVETRRTYLGTIRAFAKFLQERFLTLVTPGDIREFLAGRLDRGIGRSTIQHDVWTLRTFYDFLRLGGLVRRNAARDVSPGKAPKRLPRVLTIQEIERLIAAAKSPRDLIIIELLYATGCRLSEIHQLRVEDVDLVARSILIPPWQRSKRSSRALWRVGVEGVRPSPGRSPIRLDIWDLQRVDRESGSPRSRARGS